MKVLEMMLVLMLAVAALTACASGNATGVQGESTTQRADAGAMQAEAAVERNISVTYEATQAMASADRPVDLDLTKLSGTVVYSQVYDMMMNPEAYMGQRIKVKGGFSYFQNPDTQQEYFAAIIADATACCAQGIEFVWEGAHSYPRDYPPLDTEVTVTGTFSTYDENGFMYIQLVNAQVEWNA